MADLAQAIVDLAGIATERRAARRQLEEATSIVAAAIRKHLRRGDMVEVDKLFSSLTKDGRTAWKPVRMSLDERSFQTVEYHVQRFLTDDGPRSVLCRGGAVLEPIAVAGQQLRSIDGPASEITADVDEDEEFFHRADGQELMHFAHEAASVVAAFAEELQEEASGFAEAADKVAKLAVR
jgi:hypothetical protein